MVAPRRRGHTETPGGRGLGLALVRHAVTRMGGTISAVTAARGADTVRAALAHGVVQYLIKLYGFASFRDKLQVTHHLRAGRRCPSRRRPADNSHGDCPYHGAANIGKC